MIEREIEVVLDEAVERGDRHRVRVNRSAAPNQVKLLSSSPLQKRRLSLASLHHGGTEIHRNMDPSDP
jgi:hypothetical protein